MPTPLQAIPVFVQEIPGIGTLYNFSAATYYASLGEGKDLTVEVVNGFQGLTRDFAYVAGLGPMASVVHAGSLAATDSLVASLFSEDEGSAGWYVRENYNGYQPADQRYAQYVLVHQDVVQTFESKKVDITDLRQSAGAMWQGKSWLSETGAMPFEIGGYVITMPAGLGVEKPLVAGRWTVEGSSGSGFNWFYNHSSYKIKTVELEPEGTTNREAKFEAEQITEGENSHAPILRGGLNMKSGQLVDLKGYNQGGTELMTTEMQLSSYPGLRDYGDSW